jgi:2-polyprenyl-3-methyl-5-hydroxy-6-metoxy-1,4-benzoquinol methylase
MNPYQYRNIIDYCNDQFTTRAKPQEMWSENTIANLLRIKKKDGIWNLKGHLYGDNEKAVVIVGASPCLLKDIDELKTLDRSRFCIIVVNSGLKVLLKNGIKPDFVIAIDGNPRSIVDDLDCDNEDLTLICSNNVCPKIFDVWKGKCVWLPYYSIHRDLRKKVRAKLGNIIPLGGNTFSSAMSIAYAVFWAQIFVLVGSELCYDKQYYPHKKSKWEDKDATHFRVKDVKGRKRFTNAPLFQYKMWIEKMMSDVSKECHFYDTSFGLLGTDCNVVKVMSLKDAKKEIMDAFDTRDRVRGDWRLKEKMRYDAAYSTEKYTPENAIHAYQELMKPILKYKFKKVLDVGCGIGQGVAIMRNKGIEAYGIDISEKIVPFWEEGNITQFCQVACADKIPFPDDYFDLVICTEVMEHVPEEGVRDVLREIKRVGKQFFFTIALATAVHKMPHDGSEPHICVKSPQWWKDVFEELGFDTVISLASSQASLIVSATRKGKHDKNNVPGHNVFLQPRKYLRSHGAKFEIQGGD